MFCMIMQASRYRITYHFNVALVNDDEKGNSTNPKQRKTTRINQVSNNSTCLNQSGRLENLNTQITESLTD